MEIKCITIKNSDVIVIKADFTNMSPSKMNDHAKDLLAAIKVVFPDNKVLVIDHKTDMTIFSKDDEVK